MPPATTAAPVSPFRYHTGGVRSVAVPDLGGPVVVPRRGRASTEWARAPSTAACTPPRQCRRIRSAQTFPNDPTGAKGAYLAWRYGDTTDTLTGGRDVGRRSTTTRSTPPDRTAARNRDGTARGRARRARCGQRQRRPAGDARSASTTKPAQMSGPWHLDGGARHRRASSTATLMAGERPGGRPRDHRARERDRSPARCHHGHGWQSHGDGADPARHRHRGRHRRARRVAVLVYRGAPSSPDGHGAQTLVTGGAPIALRAEAFIDVPDSDTTVPTTTVPRRRPSRTRRRPGHDRADDDRPDDHDRPGHDVPTTTAPTTTRPGHDCSRPTTVAGHDCPPTIDSRRTHRRPTAVPSTVVPQPSLPRTGVNGDGGDRLARHCLPGGRRRPAGHPPTPRPHRVHCAG